MKKLVALLLVNAVVALSAPPAPAGAQANNIGLIHRHERAIPNQYIVVFKDTVARPDVSRAAAALASSRGASLTYTYEHSVRGFAARMSEAAALALTHDPRVDYVEEDALVEGASVQTSAPAGLDRIDQRDLPLDSKYNYYNTGAGVSVYVIDTGIRTTHQEFGGRASVAYDALGGDGQDCHGHGTHIAGIVGGTTYGVAKGVQLKSVRVLGCSNSGPASQVIAGIDWVAANHSTPSAALMAFSIGSTTTGASALDAAVSALVASGVPAVVAAGNNNLSAGTRSPGRVAEAITVGAVDQFDTRASTSNFGSALDLFAPGVNIDSADWSSDTATATRTGTSMAAAFTAGVVARYLSGNPSDTPLQVAQALTGSATTGHVINPGTGSPNRLLYRPQSKLLFSEDSGQTESIFVMNADGTGVTQLTTQNESEIRWSPDGTKISFVSQRDGNQEIYVMNADGTGQTRLTNNSARDAEQSWSPDGTKLAFISERDGNPEVYVVSVSGGTATRLTNNTSYDRTPEWSPGGTKIAYVSGGDKVWLMNADGTGQAQLTTGASYDYNPRWSPDGTKLAYTSNGGYEIGVINADGTNQHTATSSNDWWSEFPVWSPNSTRIAFLSSCPYCSPATYNAEVFTVNADGTNLLRLTNTEAAEDRLMWTPDGTEITFSSYRDGNSEIYVMNADGTGQTNLSNNAGTDSDGATSPAGDKIAFLSDRNTPGYEIFSLNPDGTGRRNLTNSTGEESSPVWSPDGTKIAYLSYLSTSNSYEIYAMNPDGTNQTRLTNNAANDVLPAFSPDSTKIAFVSSRDGGAYEVYVMNADGTGQTRLTNNSAWDNWPTWSPDGAKIYFVSDRGGNYDVYSMNADGSGVTDLTNSAANESWYTLSPDGSKIATVYNNGSGPDIWVMNSDGTGYADLTPSFVGDYGPHWSPDGGRIAFSNSDVDSDEIYVMNADGTGRTRLTFNFLYDDGVDWSPDGSKITTHGETPEGITYEIFMMDSDGANRTQVTHSSPNGGGPDAATWQPL